LDVWKQESESGREIKTRFSPPAQTNKKRLKKKIHWRKQTWGVQLRLLTHFFWQAYIFGLRNTHTKYWINLRMHDGRKKHTKLSKKKTHKMGKGTKTWRSSKFTSGYFYQIFKNPFGETREECQLDFFWRKDCHTHIFFFRIKNSFLLRWANHKQHNS